jgi:tetratricopeptide (TPR) repeat protein
MPDDSAPIVHTVAQDSPAATMGGNATATLTATPPAVGRYALGAEIARGGMGAVYRATDTALDREVAVKVLQERFGPESGAARRFLDEAKVTGQLQHPGIPPVHDAGNLPGGRPFLAMKLVKGDTLDRLLKARPDPAHDRGRYVAVFEHVCNAVAFAHRRGVIHRDLKPSNVMVGGFGETQVMDWGLAKVLGAASPTDAGTPTGDVKGAQPGPGSGGSETVAGSVLGTPAYMPPEAAAGAVHLVDARSDVFGLGAVLAVILTGQPPFAGGSAESTRVRAAQGELADCFARLNGCGADPELVGLCKRCLNPKREDRPADAAEVAAAVAGLRAAAEDRARRAELDRASAELKATEGRKRRRVWLGLAAALAAGLAASVALTVRAENARGAAERAEQTADARRTDAEKAHAVAETRRQEAEARRKEAEDQTALANAVKDFLKNDVLMLADPARQQEDKGLAYDADVKLRNVVLRAAKAIDGKFADRPMVEAELRFTVGYALEGMGRHDLAVDQYERARALYDRLVGPDHPQARLSANNLANSYSALGRNDDALRLREEVLAVSRAKLGPGHPDTLTSLQNLAISYYNLGRLEDARRLFEEASDQWRARFGPGHPGTLLIVQNLAAVDAELGRLDEARRLLQETFALQAAALGADHPETLTTMQNLAAVYAKFGRLEDARRLEVELLKLRTAKLGPDHPDTLMSMNNLAYSYELAGQLDDAVPLYRRALAGQTAKLGPDHAETRRTRRNLAQAERIQGLLGRLPAALAGTARPIGPAEAVAFAELCRTRSQNRFAAAVRFYDQAFAADPALAETRRPASRYNAACSAAQAARGDGTDAPASAAARAGLRAKALAWLRADLAVWGGYAGSRDPGRRQAAATDLSLWLQDSDLSATRPGLPRIGMPAAERAEWDHLWADVRAALAEAQKPAPPPEVAPMPRTVGAK